MNFFLLSLLLTLCAAHGANNPGNDNAVDDAPVPHNPYETVTEMLAKLAAKATDADLERLTAPRPLDRGRTLGPLPLRLGFG